MGEVSENKTDYLHLDLFSAGKIIVGCFTQMDGFTINPAFTSFPLMVRAGLRAEDTVQREEQI